MTVSAALAISLYSVGNIATARVSSDSLSRGQTEPSCVQFRLMRVWAGP
jgi:hypothetical protein